MLERPEWVWILVIRQSQQMKNGLRIKYSKVNTNAGVSPSLHDLETPTNQIWKRVLKLFYWTEKCMYFSYIYIYVCMYVIEVMQHCWQRNEEFWVGFKVEYGRWLPGILFIHKKGRTV